MKHTSVCSDAQQRTARLFQHRPVMGSKGVSIAPPAYGIDFVDRQQLTAEEMTVQRYGGETSLPPVKQQENRTGLPDHVKAGIESISGFDMSNVRVHFNSSQPAQLNALAYTQGTDIHVAPGQEQHLPHEAWHVVQQKQGRVQPTLQLKGEQINDDQRLEQEADVMGQKASQAGGAYIQSKRSVDLVPLSATPALQLIRPLLCLAGTVVQREEDPLGTIQIVLGGNPRRITDSHLATNDRPGGSIKGTEGSHTTAWIVTVEGIRQAIQGKTLADAVTTIDTLYNLAKSLPGVDRKDALSKERRDRLAEIEKLVDTNKSAAADDPSLDTLQEYISAVLAYRNALPLSAAKRGSAADSASEARAIATLRNYQAEQPSTLRAAIFKLLDKKAITDYQEHAVFSDDQDEIDKDVSLDHPGSRNTANDPNQRVVDIVEQHLRWVQGLFPAAYARAAITKAHMLDEFLFPDADQSDIDFGDQDELADLIEADTVPAIPAHPTVFQSPPTNDRFSTQVVLTVDSPKKVSSVIVAGRPKGVFGSSDRKHTTAWAVFVRGVKNRTEGKALPTAVAGIKTLLDEAKAMPGAQAAQATAMSDKASQRLTDRRAAADAAQTSAVHSMAQNNIQIRHQALQHFIHAYLAFRNAMALTAAVISSQLSTSGGKAEGRSLATLDSFEETGSNRSASDVRVSTVGAFWKLFDFGALKVMSQNPTWLPNTAGVTFNEKMPGVNQNVRSMQRVVNVLTQHILTVKSAYPNTVQRLQTDLNASLEEKLRETFNEDNTRKRVANTIRGIVGWPRRR